MHQLNDTVKILVMKTLLICYLTLFLADDAGSSSDEEIDDPEAIDLLEREAIIKKYQAVRFCFKFHTLSATAVFFSLNRFLV